MVVVVLFSSSGEWVIRAGIMLGMVGGETIGNAPLVLLAPRFGGMNSRLEDGHR